MADLKIRGFGGTQEEGEDLIIDMTQETGGDEGAPEAPEAPEVPETPEVPEGQVGEEEVAETPAEEDDKSPNGDESLEPVVKPEEEQPAHEIDEELALKYLSEKLGKQITSFDQLNQEKEVVNPFENDPYLQKLYEWREKTGRPIEDWIKYQKDYSSVEDIDVAREFLQYEYPTFTKEEIDLELRKFKVSEYDEEEDIATKKLELKKYATKGRDVLKKLTEELGDAIPAEKYPQEVQMDLDLAKQVKQQYADAAEQQRAYKEGVVEAVTEMNEYKVQLTDELTIDYRISDQTKKTLPEMIDTMPHWKNQDGSWNHRAVVEDAVKIKHFDEIVKLAYEQGVSAGKEDIIKETKNVNFTQPDPTGAEGEGKGVHIEDLDDYMGRTGMRIRTKR